MKWGERETVLFVKLYLGHKCLWDTEDENYKVKFKRIEAYQDIISKFHALTSISLDQYELIRKVRSLRSTYSQEVAKIRRRSTEGGTFKSSLKWFNIWHKTFPSRMTLDLKEESTSYEDTNDLDTELEDSSQKIWLGDEIESSENNSDPDKDPFVSPTDDDYILLLKSEPQEEETQYRTRKRFKRSISSEKSHDTESRLLAKEDEFDIYGKYIASQLRCMGLQRALRVQLQIQSIVSEARIDSLLNKN